MAQEQAWRWGIGRKTAGEGGRKATRDAVGEQGGCAIEDARNNFGERTGDMNGRQSRIHQGRYHCSSKKKKLRAMADGSWSGFLA